MPKTYYNIQELTHQESGTIQYASGDIWIGNWTGINGIPREFATGTVGMSETLTAKRCATPNDVKAAIQDHESEQGIPVSRFGFKSWQVATDNHDTVIVTINKGWN